MNDPESRDPITKPYTPQIGRIDTGREQAGRIGASRQEARRIGAGREDAGRVDGRREGGMRGGRGEQHDGPQRCGRDHLSKRLSSGHGALPWWLRHEVTGDAAS